MRKQNAESLIGNVIRLAVASRRSKRNSLKVIEVLIVINEIF